MTIVRFPGWRYGPNGEAQIFQTEADVPKGWTDNPNDFKEPATVTDPEPAVEAPVTHKKRGHKV